MSEMVKKLIIVCLLCVSGVIVVTLVIQYFIT